MGRLSGSEFVGSQGNCDEAPCQLGLRLGEATETRAGGLAQGEHGPLGQQREGCRAFEKAGHPPIAGTSSASPSPEKL